MSNLYIGISGAATVGKDTYYRLLKELCLEDFGVNVVRFALADVLKIDLQNFIISKHGINILNCSVEDKNKVRFELVNHARKMRQETNGRYWISKLDKVIENYRKSENFKSSDIFCVTDIRHFEYPSDEVVWLKEENKGFLIYVEKFFDNGSVCNPANDDERRNDPFLREHSDYRIRWRHADPEKDLKNLVKTTIDIFQKEGRIFTHDRLD